MRQYNKGDIVFDTVTETITTIVDTEEKPAGTFFCVDCDDVQVRHESDLVHLCFRHSPTFVKHKYLGAAHVVENARTSSYAVGFLVDEYANSHPVNSGSIWDALEKCYPGKYNHGTSKPL